MGQEEVMVMTKTKDRPRTKTVYLWEHTHALLVRQADKDRRTLAGQVDWLATEEAKRRAKEKK